MYKESYKHPHPTQSPRPAGQPELIELGTLRSPLRNLVVALLSPLALPPFSLLVLHLCEFGTALRRIIQGTLKATSSALPQAPPSKCKNESGASYGGANIDTNMSTVAEIVPLFGQSFGWLFVEFCFGC